MVDLCISRRYRRSRAFLINDPQTAFGFHCRCLDHSLAATQSKPLLFLTVRPCCAITALSWGTESREILPELTRSVLLPVNLQHLSSKTSWKMGKHKGNPAPQISSPSQAVWKHSACLHRPAQSKATAVMQCKQLMFFAAHQPSALTHLDAFGPSDWRCAAAAL